MSDVSQNTNVAKTPVVMDLDEIMNEVRALHQGLNQATDHAAAKSVVAAAPADSPIGSIADSPIGSIESIIEDVAQDLAELSSQQVTQTLETQEVTKPVEPPVAEAAVALPAEESPAPVLPASEVSMTAVAAVNPADAPSVVVEESLAIPTVAVPDNAAMTAFQSDTPVQSTADSMEEMLVGLKPTDANESPIATVTPLYNSINPSVHESKPENTGEVAMKSVVEQNVFLTPSARTTADAESALSIQLSGAMSVKLKYECDGQEVQISFSEQCLKVQFTDGTEFKIPVARGAKARQAA